jgi:hypothetical protein
VRPTAFKFEVQSSKFEELNELTLINGLEDFQNDDPRQRVPMFELRTSNFELAHFQVSPVMLVILLRQR